MHHIVTALLAFGFQHFWAYQVVNSAKAHGLEPAMVAGVILSEHAGVLRESSTTVANSKSKCVGLGQIAPWWIKNKRFNELGTWAVTDLRIPIHNIEATARVLRIAREDHLRAHGTKSTHHWLAHYKCGWKGLDNCKTPTRNALRYVNRVRRIIEGLQIILAMR